MAEKVELVIKIPKYYLTHPQDYSCLAECVRRGALLPKGHGRLFDERDIVNGNYEVIGNIIYELEPIIEADKKSEV